MFYFKEDNKMKQLLVVKPLSIKLCDKCPLFLPFLVAWEKLVSLLKHQREKDEVIDRIAGYPRPMGVWLELEEEEFE